nr:hypothetical protein [Lachnospiraceae bacterium]
MSWKTEYPRVLLKRDNITILDEGWTLNGTKINMPYPPQSELSGYGQKVKNHLSYEVAFEVLEWDENEDIVLHFGAVDQVADVYVNQIFVGHHEGGYLPFSFHIAKALKPNYNILQVDVTDTLNRKYPYGKQSRSPHGMWYTQVSGIWQSVWLERVPRKAIKALYISTTMTTLTLDVDTTSATYDVLIKDTDNQPVWQKEGIDSTVAFTVDFCEEGLDMKLWDTEHPYLYNLELFTKTDHVYSYFGLREIKVLENNQIALNNQPVFLHGILDQGYFPEGIFLPKDPGEYEKDVLRMKELGFNMIRKHVKVEPEQFYYACDKHG